ncbi:MAG: DUF1844 domain-containing protein [Candidatus Omnitrophica bacterium]|nr:DUF1844 domain-containing protein [Candidatus Omnitrophota bacterium]
MESPEKKKIDEDWKKTAKEEKAQKPEGAEGDDSKDGFLPDEPNFTFFVSTLGMQASIALGDMPNPVTKEQKVDLRQAKFFIDTLTMIKDKTSGNLALEEDNFIDTLLYELKMRFVEKSKGAKA